MDLAHFLASRFPEYGVAQWRERLADGRVVGAHGERLQDSTPYLPQTRIWYYRSLEQETEIPFDAVILHRDEHLLVADKPHFLPVIPAGRFLQQTLLLRLRRELAMPYLVPLHRLDRGTAGLVLFSVNPDSCGRFQRLFHDHAIEKHYEAIAPPLNERQLPYRHASRLESVPPFPCVGEVAGVPNAETWIEQCRPLASGSARGLAHYRLRPTSGRKHQLRVHLAALGAPIINDPLYAAEPPSEDDWQRPMQLLARSLRFRDPLDGRSRHFESQRQLALADR